MNKSTEYNIKKINQQEYAKYAWRFFGREFYKKSLMNRILFFINISFFLLCLTSIYKLLLMI